MPDNEGRFGGRVAIVTGGGTGIGRAVAARLASEGAMVVIAEVKPELGEAAAAELRQTGGQSRFIACDVSSSAEVPARLFVGLVAQFIDSDAANFSFFHFECSPINDAYQLYGGRYLAAPPAANC